MSSRIEMTRQELWELVWSMPLIRAAETLMEHMRNTDDGSSPRLAEIMKWADGYVAEVRSASSAAAVDRGAADWGIW